MRSLVAVRREIHANWADIVERSSVRPEALGYLPATPKILGSGHKTELGERLAIFTAVVYMAPHNEAFPRGSRKTMCPGAGKCALACLGFNSGLLVTSTAARSRLWKTALFRGARALYRELISLEIAAHERKALAMGKTPAIRVDGCSDTGYGATLAPDFPATRFYDYTKIEARLSRPRPDNYHLTYSVSEKSPDVLPDNVNWAVVFDIRRGDPMPATYRGRPVINGDAHDARFLDAPGVAVGLAFKAASDRDGHRELAGDFLN